MLCIWAFVEGICFLDVVQYERSIGRGHSIEGRQKILTRFCERPVALPPNTNFSLFSEYILFSTFIGMPDRV